MDHNDRFPSSDTRFHDYSDMRSNLRNSHGNFGSTATRFEQSRVHRHRYPPQQLQHPYFSNSWSRRSMGDAQGPIVGPNLDRFIPLQYAFGNSAQFLNAYYRGRGIPTRHGCAWCQSIPLQQDLYATAQPLNCRYPPPNHHLNSNHEQAREVNYGTGSNIMSGENLIENYVYEPRQENSIQLENQRLNAQINFIQVHLHIHSPLLSVEITDEHDEDETEEAEETQDNDGLTEQAILDCLNTKIHHKSANEEAEICVVCQSEYEEDEVLGCLDCGHEYHAHCIKRWLLRRNLCPVCKRTAF